MFWRVLYSRKYLRSLNLVVCPQTDCNKKKIFKFDGGVSGRFIKECYNLLLEVLEQSHEFTNLELAACER